MFIDTHCHLTSRYISGDLSEILLRAKKANVGILICATASPKDIPEALKITESYSNVFATVGIHPEGANEDASLYLTDSILKNPKVVGVGEIGLDYHFDTENHGEQIRLFTQQLEIAKKYGLPVVVHSRDAEEDTIEILKGAIGVMHCFTGSWNLAKTMLDRGFYFSASGILTFKNAENVREVFSKIPMDRIVIETDSPYCAPVPFRGKICEPAFLVETAKKLAEIKKLQIDELESILQQNTERLYPKCRIR